jgi:hypothetical protein
MPDNASTDRLIWGPQQPYGGRRTEGVTLGPLDLRPLAWSSFQDAHAVNLD